MLVPCVPQAAMSSLKKALGKLKRPGRNSSTTSLESDAEKSSYQNGNASPRRPASISNSHKDANDQSPRSSSIFRRDQRTSTVLSDESKQSKHHSPVTVIKNKLLGDDSSSDGNEPLNREGEKMSKNQLRKAEKIADKENRRRDRLEKEKEVANKRAEREKKLLQEEPHEMRARYGELPVNNYASEWKHEHRLDLRKISAKMIGEEVVFRARLHSMRVMSTHLVFFVFRQQTVTIQGVLQEHDGISAHFLFWAEHCDPESVVLVQGIVQEPKAKQGQVLSASIHDCEISVQGLHVEGQVSEHLPFTVNEAEFARADAEQEGDKRHVITDRLRLANRILDLRTTSSQSIFRVQSSLCRLFREYLDSQGFIEIHTPKLQGGATESGASVFKLDYFGRPAFLAQSPQLAKQMCISADFGKVYEVGAVFRAENSNTHRHMTEYTGLDIEMAIDEHYHEVLRMLDRTFKHMFKGIYEQCRPEIDVVKHHFPHEDLVWLEETPRIPFAEGVRLLNQSGWRDEDGKELPEDEDLGTRDEIQLGKLVKEKYGADYYILDKFPAAARPFYAMPDPLNPNITNSFDIFLRGQEILSGGQRIHDAKMLIQQMEKLKMDPRTMEEYIQGFEWGAPPHGGGGIGLERMLMLLLNLGDIRHGTLFPRDPKSLPAKPIIKQLRHPDASTMHPPWEGYDRVTANVDFQPLEKLIANYGDASNTSWLEPRVNVWRDDYTGAAVGWVPQDGFAITVGDPLCHHSQYVKTIAGYLRYIKKEKSLKPLWLLVGANVEEVLAERFNWRTFSVAAEQRLDPSNNPAEHDRDVQRKIRHATKEGVKIIDFPIDTPVPKDLQEKIDERVKDWQANRKGKQVHLTDIHLWVDMEHRQYHYAIDASGTISAVVVLAQLSPDFGWQVKYSLDFPGAPSGTIEYIITHALKNLAANGCTNVTFGGGASANFTPGHNLRGAKVKMLSKAYNAIATELKLTNKSEFREKMGAREDPIYICYPPHGLGPMGVRAIMNFFEDDP